jgi:pimeloyl-ACP methyl ester carboxylesterase
MKAHHGLTIRRNSVVLALVGALGWSLVSLVAAGAAPLGQARTTTVEGRTIAYRVFGGGRPVVVMLAGLGDGMDSFAGVAPDLAQGATVVIYDRAGYGGSAAEPGPRDAAAVDRELSGLLAQIGVRGPFVLAGHSLGGSFAEYYAARHPEQVAGLILEESRPAGFGERCLAAGAGPCAPTSAMVRTAPIGTQAEVAGLSATMAELAATQRLAGKPVLVLSRPAGAEPRPFDAVWRDSQAELATAYPGSEHRIAPAGGHYIHKDQRDWYLGVVRAFLAGLH